jgi:NAD(P)-dependent dehydrogenase (short-subunit alcohol dehydrogenase family)
MMLKDKIAIVTGAAGGLGLASATSFAEHGAKVVICDVADDKGEAAAQGLRDAGHDVQYRHCDVTKKADIQAGGGRGRIGPRPSRHHDGKCRYRACV